MVRRNLNEQVDSILNTVAATKPDKSGLGHGHGHTHHQLTLKQTYKY